MAGYPDDIPPFDELVEQLKLLVPDIVFPDIELDLTGFITEVCKQGFPVVPYNVYSSGGGHLFSTLVMGDIRVPGPDIENRVLTVE
jgi:hypothetical protein